MVDADAVVLLPGARLVIPESVETGSVRGRAKRVSQAKRKQFAELRARLGQEQSVVDPILSARGVARVGNDVEVAGQNERLLVFKELRGYG